MAGGGNVECSVYADTDCSSRELLGRFCGVEEEKKKRGGLQRGGAVLRHRDTSLCTLKRR